MTLHKSASFMDQKIILNFLNKVAYMGQLWKSFKDAITCCFNSTETAKQQVLWNIK